MSGDRQTGTRISTIISNLFYLLGGCPTKIYPTTTIFLTHSTGTRVYLITEKCCEVDEILVPKPV
jgi:hypothetical protein